jgi:hypothetical protein
VGGVVFSTIQKFPPAVVFPAVRRCWSLRNLVEFEMRTVPKSP